MIPAERFMQLLLIPRATSIPKVPDCRRSPAPNLPAENVSVSMTIPRKRNARGRRRRPTFKAENAAIATERALFSARYTTALRRNPGPRNHPPLLDHLPTHQVVRSLSVRFHNSMRLLMPVSGAAGPSRTKAPARGASVNSLNLGRLSLDPPGVPALGMVPKLLPPALIKPVSASSAKPKPAAVPAGPSHAKPSDIPPNAATRRPAEGALDHYLTKMGLLHCAPILYRAGFRTVTDLDMLKVNLAKEKTREEVRSMLMPREGGGMVLRDWLKLSEALVPKYGEY
ncbi:hypothetical protein B0H17DRAFT_381680 [Mycena rosella]|uniref:Uncharacterized protein n=1 Tax=Mycena rosella TaxID=1033263 RepID=A0AAD7CNK5_MYCRO|nr:hypothetical protein B0H17DRAFT_381680 [Mycena rosella]